MSNNYVFRKTVGTTFNTSPHVYKMKTKVFLSYIRYTPSTVDFYYVDEDAIEKGLALVMNTTFYKMRSEARKS